ncbi:MAG: hypothetical protein IJ681_03230 [Bacteroidales bacterium]|nr:hypothetical protein [Bacteroidales bacterium]
MKRSLKAALPLPCCMRAATNITAVSNSYKYKNTTFIEKNGRKNPDGSVCYSNSAIRVINSVKMKISETVFCNKISNNISYEMTLSSIPYSTISR